MACSYSDSVLFSLMVAEYAHIYLRNILVLLYLFFYTVFLYFHTKMHVQVLRLQNILERIVDEPVG
jgi:hypothetical protein